MYYLAHKYIRSKAKDGRARRKTNFFKKFRHEQKHGQGGRKNMPLSGFRMGADWLKNSSKPALGQALVLGPWMGRRRAAHAVFLIVKMFAR